MTDTLITPTRRAVIAGLGFMVAAPTGAAVAPLVCAPVEQIATDARAWNDAMAHYRKTVADGETFHREYLDPHFQAARARFGDDRPRKGEPDWPEYRDWCESSGFDAVMDKWQLEGEAEGDAQTALLEMPAPDLAALRWKLEHTFETDGDIALWCPEIALTIRADFLRLLPVEV
ncbi:hypothetical protein [Sphingobium xenophagum]|uniref:Uncharacterized protein n=1 Tax=Sphingobium xenophagum TaxID=121428 RepID=A0A401IZB3_SPHXE|nr:hypothetical protein [Sphingobium xenophagum]GBH29685.1 hypothetical protein MBESOW_P0939 [Sphingobium xenophagum]